MPVSKKPFTQNQLAKMHARVAVARVFGPQNLARDENKHVVAGLLKSLELRGLVVHVDGHGWVDTSTAIERYGEYTGIKELAKSKHERESEQAKSRVVTAISGNRARRKRRVTQIDQDGNEITPDTDVRRIDHHNEEYWVQTNSPGYDDNYDHGPKCSACAENEPERPKKTRLRDFNEEDEYDPPV